MGKKIGGRINKRKSNKVRSRAGYKNKRGKNSRKERVSKFFM